MGTKNHLREYALLFSTRFHMVEAKEEYIHRQTSVKASFWPGKASVLVYSTTKN